MVRRTIRLHYRACRLGLEIIVTFGAAALIGVLDRADISIAKKGG